MSNGVKRRDVIVLAGIAILIVGLGVTSISRMRDAAGRAKCADNLKQLGRGVQLHEMMNGNLPAGYISVPPVIPIAWQRGWGWGTVLNYEEPSTFHGETKLNLPPENPENEYSRTMAFPVFCCPADDPPTTFRLYRRGPNGEVLTPVCEVAASNYVGVCGTTEPNAKGDGVLFRDSEVKLHDITDGPANTLLVGERSWRTGESTWVGAVSGAGHFPPTDSGLPPELRDSASFVLGTVGGMTDGPAVPKQANHFSSRHRNGVVQFVFCDGSVRLLNAEVSGDVLRALATRAGNDSVGEN